MWLLIFDLLLLIGMTARLSRLVTTDYLGEWFIQDPAESWAGRPKQVQGSDGKVHEVYNWKQKLRVGLDCPWCSGFWIGVATVASFYLWHSTDSWRLVAGAFTLNYLVAHMSARLD